MSSREHSPEKRPASAWPAATIVLLFLGYAGYYFCRSNLALAKGSLAAEFGSVGVTEDSITTVASVALVCYAIGKVITGTFCDFVGGRIIFIGGMLGSVACTFLFLASPQIASAWGSTWLLPLFLFAFSANRFIQSSGWGALVKVASNWFSFHAYGRVMGILCMSYLFGDFLARQVLGTVMDQGTGWRGDLGRAFTQLTGVEAGWRAMFLLSGIVLFVIAIFNILWLRARPSDVGLDESTVSPANLFGARGSEERPGQLWEHLQPYLVSPSFWLVLLMSATLTFVRESSNFFNNDYLKVAAQVSDSDAAIYSSYFPLFGAVAVVITGFMTDRLYKGRRGLLMACLLTLLLPVLWAMAFVSSLEGTLWPVVLVCGVGFLSLAPYAFLSGAISMDLGGKRGSSTAAGIVDSIGYAVGGVLGMKIKQLVVPANATAITDWQPFFGLMLGLVAVTAVACVAYWFVQERPAQPVLARAELSA